MQFGLSESQQMLKDNARKFFAGECPMEEVRRLMETETAYDKTLWEKMAEQGYTGIIFPEEYGGVGLGKVELALLMEESGRALLPGPFFSTVALAGAVIDAVASPEHKKRYLAPICAGEARSTVPYRRETLCARRSRGGLYCGNRAKWNIRRGPDSFRNANHADARHGSDTETLPNRIPKHARGKNRRCVRIGKGIRYRHHGTCL
jgi:hypothetical protein